MSWSKSILKKYGKQSLTLGILILVFSIANAIWHYFSGEKFQWEKIEVLEQPDLFSRLLYSALVYVTLGAFLYSAGFYKWLYQLFKGSRQGWRDYNEAKRLIWLVLILLMFFVIVPSVVFIINSVTSVFYNLYVLALYLFPGFAVSAVVLGVGYLIYKKFYAISKDT